MRVNFYTSDDVLVIQVGQSKSLAGTVHYQNPTSEKGHYVDLHTLCSAFILRRRGLSRLFRMLSPQTDGTQISTLFNRIPCCNASRLSFKGSRIAVFVDLVDERLIQHYAVRNIADLELNGQTLKEQLQWESGIYTEPRDLQYKFQETVKRLQL